jgi:hypothetical protein
MKLLYGYLLLQQHHRNHGFAQWLLACYLWWVPLRFFLCPTIDASPTDGHLRSRSETTADDDRHKLLPALFCNLHLVNGFERRQITTCDSLLPSFRSVLILAIYCRSPQSSSSDHFEG